MTTTLLPSKFGGSMANDWLCELKPDRPKYDCPNCKQLAMQLDSQIPSGPDREDVFRCCACGWTWEL
jgi:hypothetical protein